VSGPLVSFHALHSRGRRRSSRPFQSAPASSSRPPRALLLAPRSPSGTNLLTAPRSLEADPGKVASCTELCDGFVRQRRTFELFFGR
jgi:hypothetical protein